jgi:hypothetical protein
MYSSHYESDDRQRRLILTEYNNNFMSAASPTEQHLNLNTFQGKFDVTEFVGAVSEKLIAQSKANSGRECLLSVLSVL